MEVFDRILKRVEDRRCARPEGHLVAADVRRMVLDRQDRYGNTALHLAAWNGQAAMLDRLVSMRADMHAMNHDGLTAFTLAARYGVWSTFRHVFDKHLTTTLWSFGNVRKKAVDHAAFDWKGLVSFGSRAEAYSCRDALIQLLDLGADDQCPSSENCKGMETLEALVHPSQRPQKYLA